MPKAHVDGAGLWYELVGSGPHLVQIGGAVSAHEGYSAVTPAMAEHFTVLDYDHRGYGQSDRPEGQRYDLDVWAMTSPASSTTSGSRGCTCTAAPWAASSRHASPPSTRSGSSGSSSAGRSRAATA